MTVDNDWHVSREIPLTLIVTLVGFLVVQTFSIVWAASNMFTRLGSVELSHTQLLAKDAADTLKLVVIEDRQQRVLKQLDENGSKVDEVLKVLRNHNGAAPAR